jgi:hypothetical protein
MRTKDKLALAGQVFIVLLLVSMALVQVVYSIQVTASGGSNGESGSVTSNFDLSRDATLNGELVIEGAAIKPTTAISGPISTFEQTHSVKDSTGKSASVSVMVVNAPNGLTYGSYVLPSEGTVTVQPWVSAEQWLTVPKADSIKATESASYGTYSADVGIEEVKGTSLGGYATLTDYYGKAYASATQVDALQTATEGSANSIRTYGHASDGSASFSIDTPISSISGSTASLADLDASSSAGTFTQVTQEEHIKGGFTSTAKAGTKTVTRTSNYGTEYDLDMNAAKGSSPIGILGYYVDITNPSANEIQGAVNAAASGDWVNVASGKYLENVQIDKSLVVNGAGKGSTIVDGKKAGSVFTVGKWSPNVDVTLSGMTIQNGAADYGAGIWNMGRTTVTDSTVSGNIANYDGGGINNKITSQLTIQGASDISGNTAGRDGGGIINGGMLKLEGSKLSENIATGDGGGIFNYGSMTMTGGSISKNTAKTNDGGGIANFCRLHEQADLTVSGTTISSNSAANWGGGIASDGIAAITGSTITGNNAAKGAGVCNSGSMKTTGNYISGNIASLLGGGIYNDGTVTINGDSISGNIAKGSVSDIYDANALHVGG